MREGSSLRETSKDVEKCANCIVLAEEKRQQQCEDFTGEIKREEK